jgi:hypothetical protein
MGLLDPGDGIRLMASNDAPPMLRIQGDRDSLLAALTAHWADQQLQIPSALRLLMAGSIQPASPEAITGSSTSRGSHNPRPGDR